MLLPVCALKERGSVRGAVERPPMVPPGSPETASWNVSTIVHCPPRPGAPLPRPAPAPPPRPRPAATYPASAACMEALLAALRGAGNAVAAHTPPGAAAATASAAAAVAAPPPPALPPPAACCWRCMAMAAYVVVRARVRLRVRAKGGVGGSS